MKSINANNLKEFIKRYAPVSGFVLLTVVLMIFFRLNKKDIGRLIEEGKKNLISFYAQNLKPLLVKTEISNEDVFNFALYQSIPIDKEKNRVLIISDQQNGSQVYEIKPVELNTSTDNYKRFVDFLRLDDTQKHKADSILNGYKKELYLSVFTNDKNTVAVNPKVGDLQKAVLADLVNFAQNVNPEKANELFTDQFSRYDKNKLTDFASSAKELPQNEYIFFTPDTVFKSLAKINQEELLRELNDVELNKAKVLKTIGDVQLQIDINKQIQKGLEAAQGVVSMALDTNFYCAVVPPVPNINVAYSHDSVRVKLDRVTEKLKQFSVKFDKNLIKNGKQPPPKIPAPATPEKPIQFNFSYYDPTAIAEQALKMVAKQNIKDWEKFGAKMDSIGRAMGDSIEKSLKRSGVYKKQKSEKNKSVYSRTDSLAK
ncbi:MAG: hypothetical protein AB1521_15065 [Bacteroidota bacterium]